MFDTTTNQLVLLGTSILGLACGAVGSIAVLRRQSLLGDALAHAALPGVCASFLLFHERSFILLLIGALASGLLSLCCIWSITHFTKLKQDAALGVTLTSFFGLGIVLSRIIQNEPYGNRAGLDEFIFGKAASMAPSDVLSIIAVCGISGIFIFVFFKELKLLCFDRAFMGAQGFRVKTFDLAVMILICLCVTAGLPAVGAILVSALLIIPAVTARLIVNRFSSVILLASLIGCCGALLGTGLSAYLPAAASSFSRGQPTGPLIVLSCAFLFLIAAVFSKERGLLKQWRK